MITAEDILTSDGKRPEMLKKATKEQKAEAEQTAGRITALLDEIGLPYRPAVNDGLRPQNAPYGAKKSAHKEGKAGDLSDKTNGLKYKIVTPEEVKAGFSERLKRHGLRMESPDACNGWCHLDTREPAGSIFRP